MGHWIGSQWPNGIRAHLYHQEASRRLMHKLIRLNNDPLLGRVADECSQIIMSTSKRYTQL
ncbi:unnamed protein product [Trichobilharzia regenti]|nr:unnamed protein product [Trichobilharzia regenti]